MLAFSKSRLFAMALATICTPLVAAAPASTPAEIALHPDFQGQFESQDISSSERWILEFKCDNGQWSGRANVASGHWAKIEGVKVEGNIIEFYMNSEPISKFKVKIDSKNIRISGMQEIGDGRKNTFNNVFIPFTAARI
jgi:hypothetical protein